MVSFSTLEPILLYISSNVYRIDPKKRTLRAPKGYKTDFSQDIHITIQKNEFLHYDTRILHETPLILTHIKVKTSKNKVKTTKKMGKIGKIWLTLATIQKKAGEFLHIANMSSKNRVNFKCKCS